MPTCRGLKCDQIYHISKTTEEERVEVVDSPAVRGAFVMRYEKGVCVDLFLTADGFMP